MKKAKILLKNTDNSHEYKVVRFYFIACYGDIWYHEGVRVRFADRNWKKFRRTQWKSWGKQKHRGHALPRCNNKNCPIKETS